MNVFSNINFMLIVVIVILVIAAVFGMIRGMVNSLSGIIALILSVILVTLLMPVVTSLIGNGSSLYTAVEKRCEEALDKAAKDIIKDGGGSFGGMMPAVEGTDSSVLSSEMTDMILESLGKNDQTRLIQKLPLPDFVRDQMITYNNSEGYGKLDASSFKEYIVSYIASLVVNLLSFLLTLLIVWVIISIILMMLRLFTHLPIIGPLNRAGGLLIGLIKGVIFVWIIFLIFTLLPGMDISIRALNMIRENEFLTLLYNSNIFLKLIMRYIAVVV